LCQVVNAWSQFSTVSGRTWLKKFENDEFGRLSSRKIARWRSDFHFVQFEIGAQLWPAQFRVLSAINEKYGGFDVVFLTKFSEKNLGKCGRRY